MGEDKKITKVNTENLESHDNLRENIRSILRLMIEIQNENGSVARKIAILRVEIARLQVTLVETLKENQPRN